MNVILVVAKVTPIKSRIMQNVYVNVKIIKCAKKIIVGILLNVFVLLTIQQLCVMKL